MFCTGEYQLVGTHFRCHGTHGKIDLLKAIQHSCDVYFWKLAERIGLDRIAEVAREYGFGTPTQPRHQRRLPAAGSRRRPGTSRTASYKIGFATNAAIGQGDVEVTVLQMAMAYAALANGGTLFVPQVVERIEADDGRPIVAYQPKVAHEVKIAADALEIWKRGMWKVTNEPGGTAFEHGHVEGRDRAGQDRHRRGQEAPARRTSERDVEGWHPTRSHAWFAGWAPAEDPEIAIVVLVEHGGAGGHVAWPIAKQILEGYFTKIHPLGTPTAGHAGASSEGQMKGTGLRCRARRSASSGGAGSAPPSTGR